MEFRVAPIRVTFEARETIRFGVGAETNVVRGALGLALRKVSCDARCPGARACPRAGECAYARLFEPRWSDGPSGYREAPRPFVVRWFGPGNGCVEAGNCWDAGLNLFQVERPPLGELAEAFREIASAGIGRARGAALLRSFEPQPVLRFPLRGAEAAGRVTIHFVTPTELKSAGSVIDQPEFAVLIERLAERVATLGRLYQRWPPWDYADLLERSRAVRLIAWHWEYEQRVRRSSRTGERHPVGGFTGSAIYEGPIGLFLPLLEIGRWTGVGRQTVWGKGEIRVEGSA